MAEPVRAMQPRHRPQRDLERQVRDLGWFIRAWISDEEAEAMVSDGYRAAACGGCARPGCEHCDRDPEPPGFRARPKGKRASTDPRYVRQVLQRASMFPRHLYDAVPRALRALPRGEQLALLFELGMGLPQADAARALKVSVRTLQRLQAKGLETIARSVWDEDGNAIRS